MKPLGDPFDYVEYFVQEAMLALVNRGINLTPDVVLETIKEGVYIGLEVKTADGKQSKEQKAIQDRITVAGGLYFIVRSVDDVKKIFEVKK